MEVSGIGVQPIAPTTGTPAEKQNPTPAQAPAAQRNSPPANRPPSDTGNVVDKLA